MAKIIGGTTVTPMPIPDWKQNNPNRADYIKNKPDVDKLQRDFENYAKNANNTFANAIKGKKSGEIVVLTDVSPLEHEMSVKVSQGGVTIKKLGETHFFVSTITKPSGESRGALQISMKNGMLKAPLKAGNTYTIAANISCDNPNKNYLVSTTDGFKNIGNFTGNGIQSITFTVGNTDIEGLYLYSGANVTESKLYAITFENLTICEGSPETYTADENGNVNGIIGNGESMTLIPDTAGVTIEAEYNVDTKKYIDNKFAELQALILEV